MSEISNWNFKQLRTFMLVAEHKSFKRAAEEALRSQSAISAQINQLETSLGVKLFERTTRHVALTAEGAELFTFVKRGFSEFSHGIANAQRAADRQSERIRVACIPAVIISVVPEVLVTFRQRHPHVDVSIVEHMLGDVTRTVIDQEVDFGVAPPVPSPACEIETVVEDEICAVFPGRSFPSEVTTIRMVDLLDYPLFRPSQVSPQALEVFERAARKHDKQLAIDHFISQPLSTLVMISAGQGAGVLPKSIVDAVQPRDVQVLRIIEPTTSRSTAIVQRRNAEQSQAIRDLIATFRRVLISRAKAGASAPPAEAIEA